MTTEHESKLEELEIKRKELQLQEMEMRIQQEQESIRSSKQARSEKNQLVMSAVQEGVAIMKTFSEALLRMEEGVCTGARVALGAVAPTPVLVPAAEERLVGSEVGEMVISDVALAAREVAAPISDLRGSAEHRRELVETLCKRVLYAARERAL